MKEIGVLLKDIERFLRLGKAGWSVFILLIIITAFTTHYSFSCFCWDCRLGPFCSQFLNPIVSPYLMGFLTWPISLCFLAISLINSVPVYTQLTDIIMWAMKFVLLVVGFVGNVLYFMAIGRLVEIVISRFRSS